MENNNYSENRGVMARDINGPVTINNMYGNMKRLPALMPKFIEKLAELVGDNRYITDTIDVDIYDIEDKIEYNELKLYKDIVDDYGEYHYVCNLALKSINTVCRSAENKILREVSEMYKSEKRNLIYMISNQGSKMDVIRKNSDMIIDNIKGKLIEKIRSSYSEECIYEEDLELCSSIFVCYCFVKCKILEKPRKEII